MRTMRSIWKKRRPRSAEAAYTRPPSPDSTTREALGTGRWDTGLWMLVSVSFSSHFALYELGVYILKKLCGCSICSNRILPDACHRLRFPASFLTVMTSIRQNGLFMKLRRPSHPWKRDLQPADHSLAPGHHPTCRYLLWIFIMMILLFSHSCTSINCIIAIMRLIALKLDR